MLKRLFLILILLSTLFFSLSTIKIEKETISIQPHVMINIHKKIDTDKIGELIITKINLKQNLYQINSSKNNIEENVTILEPSIFPDQKNSILFLAAHSGEGKIAYFNQLNKLEKDDEVLLRYKNVEYKYIVKDIWEEPKNGYINVNKEKQDQLILTTCSPNHDHKQLIINCIKKESNL